MSPNVAQIAGFYCAVKGRGARFRRRRKCRAQAATVLRECPSCPMGTSRFCAMLATMLNEMPRMPKMPVIGWARAISGWLCKVA